MKLKNVKFWSKESFLPTKRHRNLRERYVEHVADVSITEPTAKEFPIAFIVKDYDTIWKSEDTDGEFEVVSKEIRTYGGLLWKAVRYSDYVSRAPGWLPVEYITKILQGYAPYQFEEAEEFDAEKSIIQADDKIERKTELLCKAANFIVFDGKVWCTCGEPMYVVNTFGLGHNHGGTGFFVTYHYNSNIRKDNYFNALQREEAIAYGKQVAANRGDTKSIEGMGDYDIIEVLMPEMVKRNPQEEHGDGDAFLNALESAVSTSENSTEAGLLAMTMTFASI